MEGNAQAKEQINLGQDFKVTVQTKFMQNYRIGSVLHAGSSIESSSRLDPNGYTDVLFVTGTDGEIYCLKEDHESTTGMRGDPIGMHGANIAIGKDAEKKLIVFSNQAEQLYYVKEKKVGNFEFSTCENVSIPLPPNADSIASICIKQIKEGMSIAVLYKTLTNTSYYVAYGIWTDDVPEFEIMPITFESKNCMWLGNSKENLAFATVDGLLAVYDINSKKVDTYACDQPLSTVSVKNLIGQAGEDIIFAIVKNGRNADISQLIIDTAKKSCTLKQLSQNKYFTYFDICLLQNGELQILGVSTENVLYHAVKKIDDEQVSSNLTPILSQVAQITCCGNYATEFTAFVVGNIQNRVGHMMYEIETKNWNMQWVDIPNDQDSVEVFPSYTSEIVAYDPAGAMLISTPVEVWATELTKIETKAGVYYVGPHNKLLTSTDTRGILSIKQETNTLSSSEVIIHLPAVMQSEETLLIKQFEGVQTKLYDITSSDLMDAQKADGTYLLESDYRTVQTTTSLAAAISQCMDMVGTTPQGYKSINHKEKAKGVYRGNIIYLSEVKRIQTPLKQQHWSIDFSAPQVAYKDLTAEDAMNQIMKMRKECANVQGLFSWLTKIGDFFRGVAEKIIDVTKMVVTTIVEGIKVAFDFIMDGVKYIFEQIITFVEEAFDVVEIIFNKVKVAFEDLFKWLGFIFNWNDILRSKESISYLIEQQLLFIQGSVVGTKKIVIDGIDELQSKIGTMFDWAIKNIVGEKSLLGYIEENTLDDPNMEQSYSNNFLMEQFEQNSHVTNMVYQDMLANSSVLDTFFDELDKLVDMTESNEAFSEAIAYFTRIGDNPDDLFKNLLAGLLKIVETITQAILASTKALIGALFDLVELLIEALLKLLTTEINIPFISPFYKMISGNSALTLLDAASLIMALPATVFFKIAENKAPFPDEASVNDFKIAVNADRMLRAAGFSTSNKLEGPISALNPTVRSLCKVFEAISSHFFFAFCGITDCLPEVPTIVQAMPLVAEFSWQAFSTPWIHSDGGPDCTTANGQAKINWLYINVGLILDSIFFYRDKKYIESSDDYGKYATAIYGFIHIIPTVLASLQASGTDIAANAISPIVEMSKLLLIDKIKISTKGISVVGAGVIDAMAAIAMPILISCSMPSLEENITQKEIGEFIYGEI